MCTALSYQTKDCYFGRTLDYESSYGEQAVIVPRNFKFLFRHRDPINTHYAMIGTAHVAEGYPLFYDAANEKGLAAAGLNFVGNAHYEKPIPGKENVAQFEFIPYLLGCCADVSEVRRMLLAFNLTDTPFSPAYPVGQLHWMFSDQKETIVVESVHGGIRIYENPTGVLTNNPPFEQQLFALNNYQGLSNRQVKNTFSKSIPFSAYSRGMGALGLPGDLSSQSRFVRAAFVRANSKSGDGEADSVGQFFHMLGSVEQVRGCCEVENGAYEMTIYTACYNTTKGIYYYTTYQNRQISAVSLYHADLDGSELVCYPIENQENIRYQN